MLSSLHNIVYSVVTIAFLGTPGGCVLLIFYVVSGFQLFFLEISSHLLTMGVRNACHWHGAMTNLVAWEH